MPFTKPIFCLTIILTSFHLPAADFTDETLLLNRIAFGSCYRPGKNPQIFDQITAQSPDLFLFLGDNIYADTEDMTKMRADYDLLLGEAPFQNLLKKSPVLATWDDHDYGQNDAGAEFPAKAESKVEFMRAFSVGQDHPMRQRGGIYQSAVFGPPQQRVQVIMLDTRWFRSPLKASGSNRSKAYLKDEDPTSTMLGAEQWNWLENELKEPASLTIIGSSIQFLAEEHRFERWDTFPREREKLFQLLEGIDRPVIVLSGDRHMGEIASLRGIHEITSSGLTNAGGGNRDEPNQHRIGRRVGERNYGLLSIDWQQQPPSVTAELRSADSTVLESHTFLK